MTNKPAITEEKVGAPATSSSLPSSPTSFRDTDTPSSQLLRYDQHHSARGISTRALAERCSLKGMDTHLLERRTDRFSIRSVSLKTTVY